MKEIEIEDRGNNTEKVFIPVKVLEKISNEATEYQMGVIDRVEKFSPISFFWRILKYSYFFIIKAIILIINFIRYGK